MGPVVVGVGAAELDPQGVDPSAQGAQQRREQRRRREHRDHHGDRRGRAHRGDDRDVGRRQRDQRDDDRDPSEDDRPAGGGRGARHRLLHLHALAQLELVTGDQEQRVVDAHAQPDHGRERRPDRGDLDGVAEQADDRQGDGEAEHGGCDRQRHRSGGPEGEQQDHHGRGEADRLAALRGRFGQLLADVAADRHRQPAAAGRVGAVRYRLRVLDVQVARPHVERDRDVADRLVLGEEARAGRAGGVDRPDDVPDLVQRRDGGLDGRLVLRVRQRAAVGLQRKLVLQEVRGVGGVRAREREVVAVALTRALRDDHQHDRGDQPEGDHRPVVP